MADQYANLPGFHVTYKDGGLVVPRPVVTTDSVLVIGTSTDGPLYQPVSGYRYEDAEAVFGLAYDPATQLSNGTTLMLGMLEAYNAGCRDLYLVRVGGSKATGSMKKADQTAIVRLDGFYPGALYNSVKYSVTLTGTKAVTIDKPAIKGGGAVTVTLGGRATANVAKTAGNALVLTAKAIGTAGNSIQYKIDLTEGAEKFSYRKSATDVTYDIDISGGTFTLANLISAITNNVNNTFVNCSLAAGQAGTAIAKSTLTAVATMTALTNGVAGDAETVGELVAAINNSSVNNVVVATRVGGTDADIVATTLAAATSVYLADGTDYPTDADEATYLKKMYHELHHAYALLEDYDVDSVVVLGVYADQTVTFGSTTTNFAEQLGNFCVRATERNSETSGSIACKPSVSVDQASIKTHITALLARTNDYRRLTTVHADHVGTDDFEFTYTLEKDALTGQQLYVGHLLDVVACPEGEFTHPVIGRYYAPQTAAYAGFVSSLRPESAPTNKIVPNSRKLRYKLSVAQLNDLTAARYITFRDRDGSVVITDGCTSAPAGSDFGRKSTQRIVFAAMNVVRGAAEPFIGEPNELPQQNALNTAIKSGLNKMKENGAITAYRFNISATLEQKILGESYIDLELVPAFENRKIRVSVALRATLV